MYSFLTPFKTKNLIRIGSKNDGGYIVTTDVINNIEGVLSFGIYYNWDFEKDLIEHCKIEKMILADPYTPIASVKHLIKSKNRLVGNPNLIDKSDTKKPRIAKKLYYILKKTKLYLTKYFQFNLFLFLNKKNVKFEPLGLESYESNEMRTLDYFISKLAIPNNLLFKLDIEGSEYNIDFSNKIFKRVSCLLIEFHEIEKNHNGLKDIIDELQKHNLYIFHIHLNNSSKLIEGRSFSQTIEVSFQQRHYFGDLLEKVSCKYPIFKIDSPCDPMMVDFELDFTKL